MISAQVLQLLEDQDVWLRTKKCVHKLSAGLKHRHITQVTNLLDLLEQRSHELDQLKLQLKKSQKKSSVQTVLLERQLRLLNSSALEHGRMFGPTGEYIPLRHFLSLAETYFWDLYQNSLRHNARDTFLIGSVTRSLDFRAIK